MAEPARENAADPGPAPRKPDPRASGWASAQQAMIIAAQSNVLAVREALARPDDAAALEMAALSIRVLEAMGEVFRRLTTEAVVMAEERATAYRDGYEACKKDRCRLGVIDGGLAVRGPH